MLGLEASHRPAMRAGVAVFPTVDKDFNAALRPVAQTPLERSVCGNRRAAPMIRHHQHRKVKPAKMARQAFTQHINFAHEFRADVMDRRNQPFLF